MADLSPVRETSSPAPRPASPTLAPPDETTPLISTSTAATADDETTPLLTASTSAPHDTPAAVIFASRAIYVLTILALTFSAATLVLMGVTVIIAQIIPHGYYLPYQVPDLFLPLTFLSIVSICISSVNLSRQRSNRVPASLAINLAFDVILSFYLIVYSSEGLFAMADGYGVCDWPEDDPLACLRRGLPIRILAVLVLGTALLAG
ncbi:hypothetical protein MMC17_008772, partial [Xylographa soralifera]|nr:hypothetical protein [Xylographa soralifera]